MVFSHLPVAKGQQSATVGLGGLPLVDRFGTAAIMPSIVLLSFQGKTKDKTISACLVQALAVCFNLVLGCFRFKRSIWVTENINLSEAMACLTHHLFAPGSYDALMFRNGSKPLPYPSEHPLKPKNLGT